MPFTPRRLDLARRRRGHSWSSLAEVAGVDRRTLNNYMAGERVPTADILDDLAGALEFPTAFFHGPDIDVPTESSASFRAQSKMRARQRDMALAGGALAMLLNSWIEQRYNLPVAAPADLESLTVPALPEEAANSLRHKWGLGMDPIPHMTGLLESRGIRVYSLSVDSLEVDAFSLWRDDRAFIFLNTQKSAERSRFDAAHELGHIVLHRHAAPAGRQAEEDANRFASELLMPRGSVLAVAPRFPTIPALIQLKAIWKVSLAALVHRLHDLSLISPWHYRQLYVEMGKQGFRSSEPSPAPREQSKALSQVLALLREEGKGKRFLAGQISVSEGEIDRLTFGLVTTALKGGRSDEDIGTVGQVGPSQLRLVT